jgi:hypothetical protein
MIQKAMTNYNNKNKELNKTIIALLVVISAVVLRDVTIGLLSPVWIALVIVLVLIASLKGSLVFSGKRRKGSDDDRDAGMFDNLDIKRPHM